MEYCIVLWKGVGQSLFVETKESRKKIENKAHLEQVVELLDKLSKKRGWILKTALGTKGTAMWTCSRKKGGTNNAHRKHLVVYWGGKGARIETFPLIRTSRIDTNGTTLKDVLELFEMLSEERYGGWSVVASLSSKGTKMWTLVKYVE